MGEPEPSPAVTLARLVAAMPRLPHVDPADLGQDLKATGDAISRRTATATWCAFCLVPAVAAVSMRALELVDRTRWLDLCAPHFHDVYSHAWGWADRDILTEWQRQHRGRQRAGRDGEPHVQ